MIKTISFVVTLDVPEGATAEDMQYYVREEVAAGCGNRDPADPIFNLDRDSVQVKRYAVSSKTGPGFVKDSGRSK